MPRSDWETDENGDPIDHAQPTPAPERTRTRSRPARREPPTGDVAMALPIAASGNRVLEALIDSDGLRIRLDAGVLRIRDAGLPRPPVNMRRGVSCPSLSRLVGQRIRSVTLGLVADGVRAPRAPYTVRYIRRVTITTIEDRRIVVIFGVEYDNTQHRAGVSIMPVAVWEPARTAQYFGSWNSYEAMRESWFDRDATMPHDFPNPEDILFASYGGRSYEGDALVVFRRGSELWRNDGGHCSCNGLENQWEPEPTSVELLRPQIEALMSNEHEPEAVEYFRRLLTVL